LNIYSMRVGNDARPFLSVLPIIRGFVNLTELSLVVKDAHTLPQGSGFSVDYIP
jgi:hypothetical protein